METWHLFDVITAIVGHTERILPRSIVDDTTRSKVGDNAQLKNGKYYRERRSTVDSGSAGVR